MGEKNEHISPVEKAGGLDSGIRKIVQRPKKILGNVTTHPPPQNLLLMKLYLISQSLQIKYFV